MQNPYKTQPKLNKEQVAVEFAPVVKHIANRLSARLPSGFQVDDLVQVGMIGLLEAVERYDPKR